MTPKRIKVITSHRGLAQFFATLSEEAVGEIPRIPTIPSPYAFSLSHPLYADEQGRRVFIVETQHRRYEIFHVEEATP